MSYNDDYGRRGEYGRDESYGEGRHHGRREGYGGEGRYGGGEEYGSTRPERYGGDEPYGEGRSHGHHRKEEGYEGEGRVGGGYGGGRDDYNDRPSGYGGAVGGGDYDRRPGGMGMGMGGRMGEEPYSEGRHHRDDDPEYSARRQELREHGSSTFSALNPTGTYGGSEYGSGAAAGVGTSDPYYDPSQRLDDRPRPEGGRYPHSTGTPYGGGGAYGGGSDDFAGAAHHAAQYAGAGADTSLFSNALSMLGGRQSGLAGEGLDEDDAVRQHQQLYGGYGGGAPATSGAMGSAAAMQALKMFTGGQQQQHGGGGGAQNAFVGMAMGQAAKLFDQQSAQGNVVSGPVHPAL